jgi:hypothetical protein
MGELEDGVGADGWRRRIRIWVEGDDGVFCSGGEKVRKRGELRRAEEGQRGEEEREREKGQGSQLTELSEWKRATYRLWRREQ